MLDTVLSKEDVTADTRDMIPGSLSLWSSRDVKVKCSNAAGEPYSRESEPRAQRKAEDQAEVC